jgi:hypothetical protein
MIKVFCKTCKKQFYAKPSWIKNGFGKYCSRACCYKGIRKGKIVQCFICNKDVYKQRKALSRSKSKKFFCGKSCQTIWRNSIVNIGVNHPNWKGGKHISYRNILQNNKIPKICLLCGNPDKRVLAVHHIDENRRNNNIKNLIWICYNCHALVHNYREEKERLLKKVKK